VILQAEGQVSTLLDLTYLKSFRAQRGAHGKGKDQTGKDGEDLVIRVPAGTVVQDEETREVLHDLLLHGERLTVARGGRGGRGNARFATPTNRAPRRAEKGEAGEERWLRLELKLLADVGLIGYPNVGKSSLLSKISAAKPKIAGYPFTTLIPNLGVVEQDGHSPFVVADIPGLIEGASQGAGLGLAFLRHIERTRILVHLLDVSEGSSGDPVRDFDTLNKELKTFHPLLQDRVQIVALNKIDLPSVREKTAEIEARFREKGFRFYGISAKTGEGVKDLMQAVAEALEAP
jgi:GTP-binding protein